MSIPTALACKVPAVLDSPAKPPMMKTQDEIDSSPSEGLPFPSMTSGSGSSKSPPSLKDQRHHADANTIGSCSRERDGCTPWGNDGMPVGRVGMEPWRSGMANRVMKSVPAFVLWCDDYSVHNEFLDQQHQGLLSLINELYATVRRGESASLPIMLDSWRPTQRRTFSPRSASCGIAGTPYEDDTKAHEWMIQETIRLQLSVRTGDKGVSEEMLSLLKDWWVGHIMRIDRQYASCLARTVKKDPK